MNIRLFLVVCSLVSGCAQLFAKGEDLAHCLVRVAEKIDEIDARGAAFRLYMSSNQSARALDVFEKKFAELFSANERARKELAQAYEQRETSLKSVVAYVKDILKTMDETKKKELLAYVQEYAPALTYAVLYARETVEKFVSELAQMRSDLSAFSAVPGRSTHLLDLKKGVSKAVDERYVMWGKMLALVAHAEWKYTIALEMLKK